MIRPSSLPPIFCALMALATGLHADDAADPLPSWNQGASRAAIVDFVTAVTTEGGPKYVPPAERVAVFDNDGTLWPENPVPFQLAFALDEIRRLAPEHPEWNDNLTIQAALKGESKVLAQLGRKGLIELLQVTHSGMTTEEYDERVRDWLKATRHPRFDRPYNALTYQPMQEVLEYLRSNGFKTYIVSGGGADFMRVWAEETYGIPPEQVIGSYGKAKYELRDGVPTLTKEAGIELVDDHEGKPVAIHRFIGRRPILCFGNSDGDENMLEWTTIGRTPSLGVIVRHTDADREYAYDREPKSTGKLTTALDNAPARGWVVVDMKADWKRVFSPSK